MGDTLLMERSAGLLTAQQRSNAEINDPLICPISVLLQVITRRANSCAWWYLFCLTLKKIWNRVESNSIEEERQHTQHGWLIRILKWIEKKRLIFIISREIRQWREAVIKIKNVKYNTKNCLINAFHLTVPVLLITKTTQIVLINLLAGPRNPININKCALLFCQTSRVEGRSQQQWAERTRGT